MYAMVYSLECDCNIERYIGLPKDEWAIASKLLKEYSDVEGNVIKVFHDEGGTISLIYIQLAAQRQLFKKYGEMAQLDGTYGVRLLFICYWFYI